MPGTEPMPFSVVEPGRFLSGPAFRQDDFLAGLEQFDWASLADQKVLVRGCGDIVTPPWAYMAITARLVGVARSVRYGNEHDNVVIYRRNSRNRKNAENHLPS
jgi:hypothetical protein